MYGHALKMFSFGEVNEGFCDYFEDYQLLEFTPENPIEKQLPELLEAATDVLGQPPPFSWHWDWGALRRRYWIPEDDVETRKSILRRAIEITKSLLSLEEAIGEVGGEVVGVFVEAAIFPDLTDEDIEGLKEDIEGLKEAAKEKFGQKESRTIEPFKMRVNPEESAEVQKVLFANGYTWADGDTQVLFTEEPFLDFIYGVLTFNTDNIEFELRKHIPELTYEEFMAKYGNKQPDKYRLICRYPNLPWKISVGDVVAFDEPRQQYVWTSDDDKRHHITFSREEIECFPGFWEYFM